MPAFTINFNGSRREAGRGRQAGEAVVKILYVAHSFPPFHWRGTEVYALELATAMADRHRPHVFYLRHDPEAAGVTLEDDLFRGLPVTRARQRIDPADLEAYFFGRDQEEAFRARLNSLRPEVVHFVYLAGGLSLLLPRLARESGAKTFITVTDFSGLCPRAQLLDRDGRPCPGPRSGLRCAWCLFGYTFIAGHSRVDRLLRERLPLALAKAGHTPGLDLIRRRLAATHDAFAGAALLLYPNPNCARRYRQAGFHEPSLTMDYGIDLQPFAGHRKTASPALRIGFVGQLLPHKGLHVLAEAARGLPGDWRLIVHGRADDPGASEYLKSITLPDRVEMRGAFPFEQMNRVLEDIDLLVVPSTWQENCPLIVKYAIATRTPALLADQPGMIADRDQPTLRFFPPGDAAALRRALVETMAEIAAGKFAAGSGAVTDIRGQAEFLAGRYREAVGGGGPRC
jgi:glycosyltransferase involved in cell wall biosynthesis